MKLAYFMTDKLSKYHYNSPHQMSPLLPSEQPMNDLRPLVAELINNAKDLASQGMPQLRSLLRETLRPMNSFYTNKIEGQHTEPLMIERALKADFSDKPDEAKKQRIAIAHIATERWGEITYPSFDAANFFQPGVLQAIHRHLHTQLLDDDLIQTNDDGTKEKVHPGEWRTAGVKIGNHIPPDPATVPVFMEEWQRGYSHSKAGENAVVALMAAHHRFAWIHPFTDGNGRTARLHTHLGLNSLGLTQGLWSPMRGLAREQANYYAHLIAADKDRQGDYDGRGVLSEKGLVEFIQFLINTCLDQVSFMSGMLDIPSFEARLREMLAAESTKDDTKALKVEAATPLAYLGTVKSMERTKFKGMMGLASRTSDRALADLFKLGIITSKSPKGPVELALPLSLFRYLFPRLWPEAEVNTIS
ncbi:filamentation induced by cAMP protein [Collimonas fungivorans Ter331]|uniref:Filamentation induced by cAMP protein n=2 Tax=Collimonas fungivorans TaxID=158899 RepID=G0A7U1_COLFT|nr:filamentation induced by cAMP protein [Collimonas fungivorans Ter331]